MTRLAEDTPVRLRFPITVKTDRAGRILTLAPGTVGGVLLDLRDAYEVEFVLAPSDPTDWAATDYVTAVLEDDQVEALPRSEWSRL